MTPQHLQLLDYYYNNLLIQTNLFIFILSKESGIDFLYSNTFSILFLLRSKSAKKIVTLSFIIVLEYSKSTFLLVFQLDNNNLISVPI